MVVYDDKTVNTIRSGNQLLVSDVNSSEDVIFKASYIISEDLNCHGKITALFDLIVFGDIQADEIEVKGRFICMGHCNVSGAIVVQNDIWCEDIRAASVSCHERIVAQSIDATTIFAEGNIIIGKTLAIEELARTNQNILCGETAYGAGKIVASRVLTVEPLDLDDGDDSIEPPFQYYPKSISTDDVETSKDSFKLDKGSDILNVLSALMKNGDVATQRRLNKYFTLIKTLEKASTSSITEFRDSATLLWLIEMAQDDYFKGYNTVIEWRDVFLNHFQNLAEGRDSSLSSGKPADRLQKGFTVSHAKFGLGVVKDVVPAKTGTSTDKTAIIEFNENGKKKFPLPDSLKFFLVLSETPACSTEEIKNSITCEINTYEEWLVALGVINENKEFLGVNLHSIIFKLLVEKLGLKAKFVEERFKEKGWD